MQGETTLIWNPIHQLADERFHAHVEIQAIGRTPGKLKYAASSESLWGLWTNDSLPSQKAQEPCEAIVTSDWDQTYFGSGGGIHAAD